MLKNESVDVEISLHHNFHPVHELTEKNRHETKRTNTHIFMAEAIVGSRGACIRRHRKADPSHLYKRLRFQGLVKKITWFLCESAP